MVVAAIWPGNAPLISYGVRVVEKLFWVVRVVLFTEAENSECPNRAQEYDLGGREATGGSFVHRIVSLAWV